MGKRNKCKYTDQGGDVTSKIIYDAWKFIWKKSVFFFSGCAMEIFLYNN